MMGRTWNRVTIEGDLVVLKNNSYPAKTQSHSGGREMRVISYS